MSQTISGQKTVTTAGTAVVLGTLTVNCEIVIKALDTNTDVIALGDDGSGSVTTANGYRLTAGETCILRVGNLSNVWLNSAVNGEGVSWIKLSC